MQKYLTILEKYVQWIVLGLAALFLAYMVWAYVMKPPVTVKLSATKTVLPGEVNETIATGPIARIEHDMQRDNADFIINVPDLITPWKLVMQGPAGPAIALNSVVPFDPTGSHTGGPVTPQPGNQVFVNALPVLPPAVPVALESWRTTVQFPKPGWLPPAGNAAAVAPVITENKMGSSGTWTIDMTAVSKAFNAAFSDPNQPADNGANNPAGGPNGFGGGAVQNALLSTMFLQVAVYREELVAEGKWGNRVTVPPLAIHVMQPYPGDNPKPQAAVIYEDWAAKNIDEMLSPKFYEVVAGATPWTEPGTAPAVVPVQNVIQPLTPAPLPLPVAPPVAPANPNSVRPPGTGTRLKPGGGGAATRKPADAPQDPGRPSQVYPQGRPPGSGGQGYPPVQGRPPGSGGTGYPAPPMYPGGGPGGYPRMIPGQPPYGGVRPPAMFSPNAQQGGVINLANPGPPQQILAHDDTVEPGKTYRYILQYRLLNSVYNTTIPVKDKKWHDLFALVSPESAPTGPLTIPERSELFVKNIQRQSTGNVVHFDVFTWDGKEKVKEITASSGDSIPGTSWMVVDIRDDARTHELYVLLVDNTGRLQRRDGKTDQGDQRYKDLQDDVKNAQTARAN